MAPMALTRLTDRGKNRGGEEHSLDVAPLVDGFLAAQVDAVGGGPGHGDLIVKEALGRWFFFRYRRDSEDIFVE